MDFLSYMLKVGWKLKAELKMEVGETKPLQQKEKTTQTGVRAVHLSHHDGIYGGNQQTVDLNEVGLIGLIQAITIIF